MSSINLFFPTLPQQDAGITGIRPWLCIYTDENIRTLHNILSQGAGALVALRGEILTTTEHRNANESYTSHCE